MSHQLGRHGPLMWKNKAGGNVALSCKGQGHVVQKQVPLQASVTDVAGQRDLAHHSVKAQCPTPGSQVRLRNYCGIKHITVISHVDAPSNSRRHTKSRDTLQNQIKWNMTS